MKCKTSPHCSHNTNDRDLSKPCSIEFPHAQTRHEDWEPWIDAGLNSFISVSDNGGEYLNEEDIANAKTHLTKLYRELIAQAEAKGVAEERLACVEILHLYAMKTKDTATLDLIEQIQRHILTLSPPPTT